MNTQRAGTAAVLMLMTGMASAATGEPLALPTLIVRTYQHPGASPTALAGAHDYAERAFADAGVRLTWVDCSGTEGTGAQATACANPLGPNEVILRLRRAGPVDDVPLNSMGVSLISAQSVGTPRFSTVFIDRVAAVARAARVDDRRVLGYAIAHEVGHLLLNSPSHPEIGLMRAGWSRLELSRNRPGDWAFERAQALLVRAAVEERDSSVHTSAREDSD